MTRILPPPAKVSKKDVDTQPAAETCAVCNREIPSPLTLFAAGDAAELQRAADELDEANQRQGRWSVIRHGSSERTVCCSLKCAGEWTTNAP